MPHAFIHHCHIFVAYSFSSSDSLRRNLTVAHQLFMGVAFPAQFRCAKFLSLFNFLFIHNLKLKEKLYKWYTEHLHILCVDSTHCHHFALFALSFAHTLFLSSLHLTLLVSLSHFCSLNHQRVSTLHISWLSTP